ncbi:MAG: CDP-diacylglycerol--glycerol-3-phosphate 3-phosphatidyltransferase [Thermodesulfobacteriota bacterium]
MTRPPTPWLNLPNLLSLGRIAAVPVLVLLLALGQGGRAASYAAAVIFLVAVLTDLLDGYLARRYHLVTTLGRFLDPLADKLLNMAALIMLIPLDRVPAWVAFLILAREIAVTGLRAIAVAEGIVISASSQGKQKTLTQNFALFCLLWHYPFLGRNAQAVGQVLIYLALVITYISAWGYFRGFYRQARAKSSAQKGVDNPAKK